MKLINSNFIYNKKINNKAMRTLKEWNGNCVSRPLTVGEYVFTR